MLLAPRSAFTPVLPDVPFVTEDVGFADLFSVGLDLSAVDLVIAPLIGTGFDAIELLLLLGEAGFSGRLHVRADPLPDHALVLAELRTVAEGFGIHVDLAMT